MKTRINLYLDELKPKREFFTLNNIVMCWGALIIVLVLVSILFARFEHTSKQQLLSLQSKLDRTKAELAQVQRELERKQDKSPVLRRIDKKKHDMLEMQKLLQFMQAKSKQAEFDYAQVMVDLASNTHNEIWLKSFHFVGNDIQLVGEATHGSAIPEWLNGLKRSEYFEAKTFSLLEFDKQETGVEFQIATQYSGQGVQ